MQSWLTDDVLGSNYLVDIKFDQQTDRILGWKQTITTQQIKDPGKYAMQYLNDLRYIERNFGLPDTYSFDIEFVPAETYGVLMSETISQLSVALLTVILVVLFVTVNL